MAEETTFLTEDGKIKYEKKLQHLKTFKREQIADRIRTAREFGDISENAEYESAKIEQAFVEGEINDLEKLLKRAQVIKKSDIKTGEVCMGAHVVIKNVSKDAPEDEQFTFEIVGTRETDPHRGRISNESPLGAAIWGKGVNDKVDVRSPGGTVTWKIMSISSPVE